MKNKIHHHSGKDHIKNSKSAKFGREMLKNAENIALSRQKWFEFPLVIQKYTKLSNFARLYFLHFSTFRDQILQFYYF